jgi:hypothetical protein
VHHLAAALAAIPLLAAPWGARAAEGPDLWLELGAGADSNPARAPGSAAGGQGLTSLLGRVRHAWAGQASRLTVSLTEAGRLYPGATGSDALASRVEVAGRAALPAGLALAASGVASDYSERAGLLSRHAGRGEVVLSLEHEALGGSLSAGWSLFAPRERSLRPFRAEGPEGWLGGWWTPAEEHELSVAVGLSRAGYPSWDALGAVGPRTRVDDAGHVRAEWSWRGPALLAGGWSFTRNRSGVPGGGYDRHRLTARAALRLPLRLTLAARAALQWTRYPDPILLEAQQRLAEGQESLDTLEVRLTRPLTGELDLSLALAWYHTEAAAGAPGYQRVVATLVLGWRAGGARPRRRRERVASRRGPSLRPSGAECHRRPAGGAPPPRPLR